MHNPHTQSAKARQMAYSNTIVIVTEILIQVNCFIGPPKTKPAVNESLVYLCPLIQRRCLSCMSFKYNQFSRKNSNLGRSKG